MTKFSGIDAAQAVMAFAMTHGSKLPEDQRDFLSQKLIGPDFLLKVIVGLEVLYACRSDRKFPKEGLQLLHDLADFVRAHNFYGLADRALSLMTVAQRAIDGGKAAEDSDPEISTEYTAPKPAEAPVVPAPAPAE